MTESLSHPPVPFQDEDLRCPLCGYNLRGLEQPRCPECGHQFEWHDLIERRNNQHPFHFEHHPERSLWSFFRTFALTALPRRFFRSVRPIHTLNIRRLVVYWVAMIVIAGALAYAVGAGAGGINSYASDWLAYQRLQRLLQEKLNDPNTSQGAVAWKAWYSSWRPSFLQTLRSRYADPTWIESFVIPCIAFAVLWPWLTLATLLIFRRSLRQAHIRVGQLLRCVLYSGDVAISLSLVLIAAPALVPWCDQSLPETWRFLLVQNRAVLIALVLGSVGLTYRLGVAYRSYLALRHALATAVASQVIVLLLSLKLYVLWSEM